MKGVRNYAKNNNSFSTCMMLMSMLLFYTPVSHAQSLSSKQTMVNQQNQNNTTTILGKY